MSNIVCNFWDLRIANIRTVYLIAALSDEETYKTLISVWQRYNTTKQVGLNFKIMAVIPTIAWRTIHYSEFVASLDGLWWALAYSSSPIITHICYLSYHHFNTNRSRTNTQNILQVFVSFHVNWFTTKQISNCSANKKKFWNSWGEKEEWATVNSEELSLLGKILPSGISLMVELTFSWSTKQLSLT